jgi:hypothetical protein
MDPDDRTVYLFQCPGDNLFAVSHDVTGANLPPATHTQWVLRERLQPGEPPVPAPIGYYIWRDPCWAQRLCGTAVSHD